MPNATYSDELIMEAAKAAHVANMAHCASLGDDSQVPWADAPDWQKESAIAGVKFHIDNPEADDAASHNSWLAQKVADGWKHGETKDEVAKTHHCMVPFEELPPEQQAKDAIFRKTVWDVLNRPAALPDLNAALAGLNHSDDAHWTKAGTPDLNNLKEITGHRVSRKDVENAAPDLVRKDGVSSDEKAALAELPEGADPIALMEAAFNAASPDYMRFHPSFGQVQQQFQAMLPSIREEQKRNKIRGRRFGS